jgi:hypothetical protein
VIATSPGDGARGPPPRGRWSMCLKVDSPARWTSSSVPVGGPGCWALLLTTAMPATAAAKAALRTAARRFIRVSFRSRTTRSGPGDHSQVAPTTRRPPRVALPTRVAASAALTARPGRARRAASVPRYAAAVPRGARRADQPRQLPPSARGVRRSRPPGSSSRPASFATCALAAGVSIFELARIMGTSRA